MHGVIGAGIDFAAKLIIGFDMNVGDGHESLTHRGGVLHGGKNFVDEPV